MRKPVNSFGKGCNKFFIIIINVFFLVVAPMVFAKENLGILFVRQAKVRHQLSKVVSLKCTWISSISAQWKKGRLRVDNLKRPKLIRNTRYDSIDLNKGYARMIGNVGSVTVHAILTKEGLLFMERTPSGNYTFTTVFSAYDKRGRFPAVHSRHMLILSSPIPSQYYGYCRVLK